ncbi:MAG TPA: M43 family zinc metalloprotease, partial [Gemmatimonadaceae bacterium]|nr:M43 family zinc metalloprotease [Gemmatimonadaceae bacterium]
VLNEDFMALAGTPGAMGFNSKIKFVLARWKPDGSPSPGYEVVTNDAWFEDPGSGGGTSPMKAALNWDPTRYLNIYTNDANGLLGYATFPPQSAGTARDGVVILWDSVGRNSPIGPPYNLGRTLTHEIGHYLGLYHTFQGGCGQAAAPYTSGDMIMDTMREQSPHYGCTAGASSCGGGMNPIENYMNYSDDACMTKFTAEQANRMRCSIVNYRKINTEPKAAFTATVDEQTATFTNASTDVETPTNLHYIWDFGDGQKSNDPNPTHTYTQGGTFHVTLEVVDPGSGSNKATQSVMIVKPEPPPPPPGNDAGMNGGGDDNADGGGCCDAQNGAASYALLAFPVVLVLRRRRRAHA